MNAHFHTPSFGDEVFDIPNSEYNVNDNSNANSNSNIFQHQQLQSKRMRGSMDSSLDEYHSANDESFVASNNNSALIASPTPTATATAAARKQLTPSSSTSDQNEPAKPLSAYALFFRDTVSAIKQQNPNCSFQEISRIVASMWEALDPNHKNVYNKKNEMAKNEYIKQMRIYRQQQLELQQQQQQQQQQLQQQQQQQQQLAQNATAPMQTKPAVFTISRGNSESGDGGQAYVNSQQINSSPQQQQQQQQQGNNSHYQQQFELQQQQQNYANTNHQQQQQPPQQQSSHLDTQQQQLNSFPSTDSTQPPNAQQIQLLTEAGSVQKCIRDHCNKRAIINPDWEDEYCSNECVVIHCRNVFNAWVQANLDARTQ